MRHTQKLRIWYENILFLVGDEHLVETNQNNLVAEKKTGKFWHPKAYDFTNGIVASGS